MGRHEGFNECKWWRKAKPLNLAKTLLALISITTNRATVEPPNSGQNGNGTFVHCREAVPYRKQLLLRQFSLLFYDSVGSHAVYILFRIIISCEITNIVTLLSGHVKRA